jgi:hypothetical protein
MDQEGVTSSYLTIYLRAQSPLTQRTPTLR